jgi:hypothetical protein
MSADKLADKKCRNTYPVEYYSVLKNSEILPFVII